MNIKTFAAVLLTGGLLVSLLIGWGIGAAANAIWPTHKTVPARIHATFCAGDHDNDCPAGEPDND